MQTYSPDDSVVKGKSKAQILKEAREHDARMKGITIQLSTKKLAPVSEVKKAIARGEKVTHLS